eukprot:1460942-Pyramimonas_sp.AAC.1
MRLPTEVSSLLGLIKKLSSAGVMSLFTASEGGAMARSVPALAVLSHKTRTDLADDVDSDIRHFLSFLVAMYIGLS